MRDYRAAIAAKIMTKKKFLQKNYQREMFTKKMTQEKFLQKKIKLSTKSKLGPLEHIM